MSDSAQNTSVFLSDIHQTAQNAVPAPSFDESDDKDDHLDPRHQRRVNLMQQVFAYSFYTDPALQATHVAQHPEIEPIIKQLPELDQEIQAQAPERPVSQINKVDLAILRVIVFELKTSQTPQKVVIDEGIELAKEFGTESSPRFVNGVLAQFLK
jgi:N utilization substance protein B